MKVLILNSSDIQGGAARASYRLHKGLQSKGVDSHMFVQSRMSGDFTVLGPENKFQKFFSKLRPVLDRFLVWRYKNRSKTLFSSNLVPFSGIAKRVNELNPDIVHLHWVNSGMISIDELAKIEAPIVWSLHDMWGFTGGCHYNSECFRFNRCCGNCPVLGSSKEKDLSRSIFLRKKKVFSKIDSLTVVGLSKWLARCAAESQLFSQFKVVNLPNPIDTSVFSPFDRNAARSLFHLPLDKKLILFGAMSATSDPRKGFKELIASLGKVKFDNTELVVFGASEPEELQDFQHKVHYLGHLYDDFSLRALYSSADVMIVPSLQENLSNAIMESLACSTPVVAFDIGGNSDLIDHKINGYLAEPNNIFDLAEGIGWIVNNKNNISLRECSRNKVLKCFDSKIVTEKYIDLYKGILSE